VRGRSDTKMAALAPPIASPRQNVSYFLDSPRMWAASCPKCFTPVDTTLVQLNMEPGGSQNQSGCSGKYIVYVTPCKKFMNNYQFLRKLMKCNYSFLLKHPDHDNRTDTLYWNGIKQPTPHNSQEEWKTSTTLFQRP